MAAPRTFAVGAMRFVDTNVLLYAVSRLPGDVAKRQRARELLESPDLVLSAQVLQEFYVQATRPKGSSGLSHAEAVTFLGGLRHLPVQPITARVVDDALALRERFQINYWDAAILAAARAAGCGTVYTEDLNAGQDYDGVRVVNPFA